MIKGLKPSLSEAGKIKIGCKGETRKKSSGGTWRLPVKLDHFLITTTEREKDAKGEEIKDGNFILDKELMNAVSAVTKSKGKITEIPIVLHSDEIDDVFPTSYAYYHGQKVVCTGDGERACRKKVINKKLTDDKEEVPCPCPLLDSDDPYKRCKPNGKFCCSIRVPGHAVAGAVYVWRTTSIISVQRMIGSLNQIKSVCGTLKGVPLVLKLETVKVKMGTVHCCHVELRADDLLKIQREALELASMRAALGSGNFPKGLISPPASDDESPEESADVQEEFYPEVIDEDTGEITEGLHRVSSTDRDLWGFDEAEYENSSAANGAPPPPKSQPEKREEENLKSEKVA